MDNGSGTVVERRLSSERRGRAAHAFRFLAVTGGSSPTPLVYPVSSIKGFDRGAVVAYSGMRSPFGPAHFSSWQESFQKDNRKMASCIGRLELFSVPLSGNFLPEIVRPLPFIVWKVLPRRQECRKPSGSQAAINEWGQQHLDTFRIFVTFPRAVPPRPECYYRDQTGFLLGNENHAASETTGLVEREAHGLRDCPLKFFPSSR